MDPVQKLEDNASVFLFLFQILPGVECPKRSMEWDTEELSKQVKWVVEISYLDINWDDFHTPRKMQFAEKNWRTKTYKTLPGNCPISLPGTFESMIFRTSLFGGICMYLRGKLCDHPGGHVCMAWGGLTGSPFYHFGGILGLFSSGSNGYYQRIISELNSQDSPKFKAWNLWSPGFMVKLYHLTGGHFTSKRVT